MIEEPVVCEEGVIEKHSTADLLSQGASIEKRMAKRVANDLGGEGELAPRIERSVAKFGEGDRWGEWDSAEGSEFAPGLGIDFRRSESAIVLVDFDGGAAGPVGHGLPDELY